MKMTLDPDFYTHTAIENMKVQFSEYMSVEVDAIQALSLTLVVSDPCLAHAPTIINTFLNNILELSIQEIVSHEG
ncbi:hypothetical protein [Scandinavium goeteborgense]|nr:hypothetical protein [Scandinavium goeteborgense]